MTAASRHFLRILSGLAVLLVAGATTALVAQRGSPTLAPPGDDGQAKAEHMVMDGMAHHHMHDSPHMRLTARRPERPGDRVRAMAIVAALRPAIERYRDYHVALANGYEIFMPNVPQAIYHFTNYAEGRAEVFRFLPDQATSLLYRKTRDNYELVGAMYTAPRDEPEVDLDARVPLSIAQWHAHVNICLPARGSAPGADWTKFGPDGSISTPEACKAAGGRFVPQLFGWMVHVYPFEKTLDKIFALD
jgi:hypothetical protein